MLLRIEKEMATHSSVLAWRIPGMGEPDGLPLVGSHRVVGHDRSDLAAAAAAARTAENVKEENHELSTINTQPKARVRELPRLP